MTNLSRMMLAQQDILYKLYIYTCIYMYNICFIYVINIKWHISLSSVSVKPTTLSFASFMQFKKSIAATRSALRLGTNLSLPLQAVAPQSDAAHPQHRRGEGGATPCPYAPLAEQLPDKDKEQSEEGGVSVFSGRINFLHLKLVYLILPELCRRLGFPIRFSFYCAPPLLLLLASARATLLSFFAFLRFFSKQRILGICDCRSACLSLFVDLFN